MPPHVYTPRDMATLTSPACQYIHWESKGDIDFVELAMFFGDWHSKRSFAITEA